MSQHNTWTLFKFGGTSVAGPERYKHVVEILKSQPQPSRHAVVVSAMSKVTDALIQLTEAAARRDEKYTQMMADLHKRHNQCVEDLQMGAATEKLKTVFQKDFTDIAEVLRGVWHSRVASNETIELISGYGEVWSAQILNSLLTHNKIKSSWLDAREVLVVDPAPRTVTVDWAQSNEKLLPILKNNSDQVIVITGFVASTEKGVATTLRRNGSDYSASIFGRLLKAKEIVIWTDVDGVMSADPRLVPDAVVIPDLSYAEATELAYFGAKVVHPDTMGPAIHDEIPIWIKNTFNPQYRGSRISALKTPHPPVKGFASIEDMAIINIEGTGMVGVPGVSQRLFGALKDVGVSVVMISQASSEQSICVVVPQKQMQLAKTAVENTFDFEIKKGLIESVTAVSDVSVMAMVGDGMAHTPGTAGRLFTALGRARANVLAIAQGSSERNISTVVAKKDIHRAMRAAHSAFFLSNQTLSIGVIGTGVVGATFLDQLADRAEALKNERGIDVRLRGICNSKNMVVNNTGLMIKDWRAALSSQATAADLDRFVSFINESDYPHQIIVDLTASDQTSDQYLHWIERGLNIVTANKKAGSGDWDQYKKLFDSVRKNNRYFMYETTVGAGLPVLRTIRDLIETGDELIEVEGVLSGTLSYLFNSYNGQKSFSQVVLEAKQKGYTEPDPREDLSGADVARKLVILAREAGLEIRREKVHVENLVPSHLQKITTSEFLDRIQELDSAMLEKFNHAQQNKKVLRYVGKVTRDGDANVKLSELSFDHPFSRLGGSDNIFLFRTKRYRDQPMVVQGPGAGPAVTAAGVFSELLRLSTYLGAPL